MVSVHRVESSRAVQGSIGHRVESIHRSAPRVVIVDDEPDLVELLVGCARDAGFAAHGTTDPLEMLAACERAHVEIVVVDLRMPSVDGIELLRSVAETSHRPDVVLMSGSDTSVLETACQYAGDHGRRARSTGRRDARSARSSSSRRRRTRHRRLRNGPFHAVASAERSGHGAEAGSLVRRRSRLVRASARDRAQRLPHGTGARTSRRRGGNRVGRGGRDPGLRGLHGRSGLPFRTAHPRRRPRMRARSRLSASGEPVSRGLEMRREK